MKSPSRQKEVFTCIVLQVRNAGEGHRVVDAWVSGHGRIALWARHARSSKRRFGSALSPFVQLQITAVPNDSLWQLEGAELQLDRMGIRGNLDAIGRAATLCRVVQALWPTGQDSDGLFAGLTVALDHLAAGRLARAAGLYPRLATQGGLMPDTEHCGRCGKELASGACAPKRLTMLLCRKCDATAGPLPTGVLQALTGARIEDEEVARSVEALVCQWVSLFTERPLRPWEPQALPDGPSSP